MIIFSFKRHLMFEQEHMRFMRFSSLIRNVPSKDIIQAVGWQHDSMFTRFYLRDSVNSVSQDAVQPILSLVSFVLSEPDRQLKLRWPKG